MPTPEQIHWHLCAAACGPPVGPFTFTVEAGGSGNFWSQHGGQTVGSVTDGSVSLPGNIEVSRLWRRLATSFRMNQNGSGSFVDFLAAYPDATIEMSTPHGDVTLAFADNASIGATFANFGITAAQNTILNAIVSGDSVVVTVTL